MVDSFQDRIVIRGAAEHNLKNVDLVLPKHQLILFTGVSGSGKSSLAFDTLYAEGQRRFVESLSAYARQFLGQMDKPKYDAIRGLAPTISIEQRAASANPRSTVGTVTEIYDYLRVLYARAGTFHCPQCNRSVDKTDSASIVKSIQTLGEGTKLVLLSPIARNRKGTFSEELDAFSAQGFTRVRVDQNTLLIEDVPPLDKHIKHDLDVVIDRIIIRENTTARLTDSVETALRVGHGRLIAAIVDGSEKLYSEERHCAYCDLGFPEPSPAMFSFNSPVGACEKCNGLGITHVVDVERVVPDPTQSLKDGCIGLWGSQNPAQSKWSKSIIHSLAAHYKIPTDEPWAKLTDVQRKRLLYGTDGEVIEVTIQGKRGKTTIPMAFEGVVPQLERLFKETNSSERAEHYGKYLRQTKCMACQGERLRPEARSAQFADKRLPELVLQPIGALHAYFDDIELTGNTLVIASEIMREIRSRLGFLMNVGLDYLTLNRSAATLSGGEAQRIRLASQVGSELTGVLYILDEPTVGLHPRDNRRLIETLVQLRDIGNTVLVVEHDRDTIDAADYIVDFGPGAGHMGGSIVAHGSIGDVMSNPNSVTGQYLSDAQRIDVPQQRRKTTSKQLKIRGASANNLKNINVNIPIGTFCVVTGVSGAGKSTLVNTVLLPALKQRFDGSNKPAGAHKSIEGYESLNKIVAIDQKPIGRTPRSNPATYTKVFDLIRQVFAATRESRVYGYTAGRFSFNVKGGRCESCCGAGVKRIEMHFLADVYVQCESCKGQRFNDATLRVRYKDHTIFDVLNLTIDEAWQLFENHKKIKRILSTVRDVGLGYIALGQPATTLSGGEAQRVKLSRELARRNTGKTLYIMDEPTTGLHFDDTRKLLAVIQQLVDSGNTVLVIEHNLDVVKCADYVIDLGPEGGEMGGKIVAKGTPENLSKVQESFTGQYLKAVLS